MTRENSLKALLAAQNLEEELLCDFPTDEDNQPEIRLIGFCLHKLGRRNQKIEPLAGANVVELLDYNDIHHRTVIAPRNLQTRHWGLHTTNDSEFPLMIVFDKNNQEPLALYREHGENWLYSAHQQKHIQATEFDSIAADAYEIYSSLPATVKGPFSVLRFAFSSELGPIAALFVASGVVMLFNLSIPILTNTLVSKVLPQNDQQLLVEGISVVILIVIGSVTTSFLQNLMMLRLESVADLKLQSAVWDRLMRLPMSFISQYSTGDLSSRVNSISQLRQLMGTGVLTTLLSTLFSFSFFVLMFIYDKQLALWASAFTFIAVASLLTITWRSIQLQLPLLESSAEITNFSLQSVMGMPQIRSAGAEPFLLLRWMREINRYAQIQLRNNIYNDAIEQYGVVASPIASLFLFSVVAYRILTSPDQVNTNQTIVAFISFNAAFSSFNSAVTNAVNLIANTAGRAAVLWKRAEPVIYADVEQGYQSSALHHQLKGDFKLQHITYDFPGSSAPLFNDLSFSVPAGAHTAITGPSGCGKTTLVRMLLGFTIPQVGEILIDGIPLAQLAIRSYRRQMGVVMQTARLNSGSIYDIICGGIQREESAIWDALEKAAVADEVEAMPMQLDTLISDSGGNISGGQVQRIAIARALITNPKVLIMDEATSALDNKAQQHITETINNLGITRISVAHRLSTIQNADQIVILENGQSTESGSWDYLKNHGYIKRMLASH